MPSSTTLASQLAAQKAEFLSSLPEEVVTGIASTAKTLSDSFTPSPLSIGAKAPSFTLPNATGTQISLQNLLNEHSAVVVTWYRGNWCPYCNIALRALTLANDDIEKLGAKLVCLSPETPDESMSTIEKNELKFEVLTDDGLRVADQYGIAFTVLEDIKQLYNGFGINLDEMNGNSGKRKAKLPMPAAFVLDKTGKVVYAFADFDYTKRAEPSDILDAIRKVVA